MSIRKRSQVSQEATESEGDNDGSEQASVTPLSRKRLRVSKSPYSEHSDKASETEEDRIYRSVTAALEQDEEELELLATQMIQEKYAFYSDEPNVPSEHGILERVECYNFMCHDHFQVELGPLINFIVGKNGSGKSAVLTAITLCLGGKASATNRGQSLKSFIKEGKEAATIVVRIKNQGDGAYLPDDYGNSIVVERHFSKNGASSFKIKSESGRIISTKRTELDAIIDHFTLQFENPMNVLSQDMARQFLSSSSPADKYKFFVKGVQLEQLDQDYRLMEESVDQIEEKLRNKEKDISVLKSRRDSAERKLEISDQHESLRARIASLRNQMVWVQVEEQERIRDDLETDISSVHDRIAAAESELERYDAALQEADAEFETAVEYVREATGKVDNAQGEAEEMKSRLSESMNERHDLQVQPALFSSPAEL
ncbi:P-loop containing nucleoside triphosphate hydrolase protein [Aspergillus pseudoustus]|uniref:P-loop containing nucleoside triphosphate hydrolase protein n=1 Tax=Aspergillus pseudoustus TaxID=1810923 RepID=A0ABR4JMH4_9EURO